MNLVDAIVQQIEVERLLPIFDFPKEIQTGLVEVTIRPLETKQVDSVTDRIKKFTAKYNRESFINHLKEQISQGHEFAFDATKIIDGTETEEEAQARYRQEKQTWGNLISHA